MKIDFIKDKNVSGEENCVILSYEYIDDNTLRIIHSNRDDGYYGYEFEVIGTKKELKIIKEFCDKIEEAE